MTREERHTLLSLLKVLANESRLKLLGLLSNREYSVEELATLLTLKAPTVSHHLARLREASLVQMRAEGNTHLYQLDSQALEHINRDFFRREQVASLADDLDTGGWERKVLATFVKGERLVSIPARRKKRQVILRWLAGKFDPGVSYTEPEVNAIIKRHHPPDWATLRRELLADKLMQRVAGRDWRRTLAFPNRSASASDLVPE